MRMTELDSRITTHINEQHRISGMSLSRELKIPYQTIWRHLQKLERYNLIKRVSKFDYSIVEE